MKTRRGSTGKKFLALLLVALLAISPIASDLPQLAITVDAEETSATASDSVSALASAEATGDTNLTDSLVGYYSFDGTLENTANTVLSDSGSDTTGATYATQHGGAGNTWNADATGTATYNSANAVSESAYVFSGNTDDVSETISGLAWWSGETGQDYALTDGESMSFLVECTSDLDGYAAFSVELYDSTNNYYLTTGSDGNLWFAGEAANTGSVSPLATLASTIVSGTTYLVTITWSGNEFTILYYDMTAGEIFATLTATSGDDISFSETKVHFIAQVGTYEITQTTEKVETKESESWWSVKSNDYLIADGDTLIFSVECTAVSDANSAYFAAELYDTTNGTYETTDTSGLKYLTTTSTGNAWSAEKGTYNSVSGVLSTTASTATVNSVYIVTISREDTTVDGSTTSEYVITYCNLSEKETITRITFSGTNLSSSTVYAHIVCNVSSYNIKNIAASEADDDSTSVGEGLKLDVTTSDSFTISGWVYTKQKINYQSMYFVVSDADTYINVGTIFNDCWTVALALKGGWSNSRWVDNYTKDIEIGEWTYVTLTVSSDGAISYYLDGEQVNSLSFEDYNKEYSNLPIYLGVNYWNASFCGMMDELTVYSAALTEDEVATLYALSGDPAAAATAEANGETYNTIDRVSVHDPSIVKGYVESTVTSVDSTTTIVPELKDVYTKEIYFVFGSHLAWAYSWDLVNWTTFTNNLNTEYETVFKDAFTWAALGEEDDYDPSGNMWAPDVIYNTAMEKWCMYMSINGNSWNSSIVMLTSDTLSGDWTLQGTVIYSGMSSTTYSHAISYTDYEKVTNESTLNSRYTRTYYKPTSTTAYTDWNYNYGAHAIDPCVIYDEDGNLWMSYGSWSGGIYLLALDEETGLRDYDATYEYSADVSDPYMGYHLAGKNMNSGEASYIQYVETTEKDESGEKIGYYYLYISYGGYTAAGGYNMRLFRSTEITGPYEDVTGESAIYTSSSTTSNVNGSIGLRMISYYKYSFQDLASTAQGHNSMLVDDDENMYVFYHTRSNDGTEGHQLRVRQLFMTEDGWLAAAPFEYTGAADTAFVDGEESKIAGTYEVIFHDSTDYGSLAYNEGVTLVFTAEGTVSGDKTGKWEWSSDSGAPYVNVTLDGVLYQGVFLKQSKEENGNYYSSAQVYAFTLVTSSSESGEQELAVWGYRTGGIDCTEIVAADMEALADTIPAQTVNGTALTLVTSGSNGSTITWTSSDEGIIATNGSVTVPETTTTVTLTATASYGSDSDTKTFEVTVLGADATDDEGNITVWTSPSGTTYDLTNAVQGTYSFPNYFNSEIGTAGLTLYHGVSIEFTVSRTSETQCDYLASNIIGFNAGSRGGLYFTGGSYLGYNGTGGYFDANVYDAAYPYTFEDETTGWYKGTNFIGDGATIKIVILPDTYEVYVDGELAFDMDDVGTTEGVPGTNAIGEEYSIYTSVLSYLSSTATEFDLGWGSWWDGGYTGTISGITLTACASVTDTSGYIYYEDFENLAGATGADTNFTSANASNFLSVTTDDYTDWYLKFANSGASGDRGAYMLFGEAVQSLTEYTVEVDTSLTAGVLAQRSNSEFVIMGTDATDYNTNSVVSSGYILKLYNAPPSTSTANTNDYSNQTTWYINDTETTVGIPVATWIHIKAVVDVKAGTAEVTITNRKTEETLYSGTVTVNGNGYLGGLYILNGRGVGTTSVDNISVTSYVTVTTGSVSTSGVTSIADLQGGGEVVTNSSVTVIAPEVENYTFVGWYSATVDSSGNVTGYDSSEGALATSLTYTFTAGKDIALAAVYRADSMATLTVMIDNLNGATYAVKVGDETVYSSLTEKFEGNYETGTSVTLTADAGNSEAEFAYWMNGYDKIMSTDSTYTFVVVSDTTIYPVFNTAGSSDNTAIVDYVTYYGQVLLRYTYTSDGGVKSAPTTLPTRTGYKFSGWSMTQDAIVAAITNGKSTYVKVTPEYTEIEKTYTVKVYENAGDTATLYETYSEKAAGDTLTVTARTASNDTSLTGKTFQYWAADEAGETILSYKESYMVYLSRDIDLYAIYADSSSEGVTAVSTIVMTNRYAVEESSSDSSSPTCKIAFEATRSVLETETVLETGILFSTDGNYGSSDTLKIGAESSSNVTKYVSSSTTNDGVFTLYADVTESTGTTVYARGYVVIKDSSGKLVTFYTDVIAETYNSLTSAAASE